MGKVREQKLQEPKIQDPNKSEFPNKKSVKIIGSFYGQFWNLPSTGLPVYGR